MKKLLKAVSAALAAAVMVSLVSISSLAAGIGFENASAVKSGKKYSVSIAEGEASYFIITVSKTGKLRLALNCGIAQANITLLDENETSVQPSDYSSSSGAAWWVDRVEKSSGKSSSGSNASASASGGFSTLYWDHDDKAYNGTLTYELSKGVYYIRMENYKNSGEAGTVTFLPKYPSTAVPSADLTESSAIKAMALSVPAGTSIQLGVSVSSAQGISIKWSTSDSSIVSVSSKGRITARKKGVAVITANVNGSKSKLAIQVT